MRLPDTILDSVAFLCERRTKKGVTQYECIGTAFFLSVDSKTVPQVRYNYLVTAKHCVVKGKELFLRMNTKEGSFNHVALRSDWVFSDDPSVDLAVLVFAPGQEYEYKVAPSEMLATEAKIAEHSIGIGEETAIPGLFIKRTGNKRNIPIVRFGNIAAMPTEKLPSRIKGREFHAYLVEVRSIGGLSGSPVFAYLGISRIDPKTGNMNLGHWFFFLLGVVRGHWGYDKVRRELNALTDDAKNVNMGIALVTPATELEAIIFGDHLTKRRKRRDEELLSNSALAMHEDSSITQ